MEWKDRVSIRVVFFPVLFGVCTVGASLFSWELYFFSLFGIPARDSFSRCIHLTVGVGNPIQVANRSRDLLRERESRQRLLSLQPRQQVRFIRVLLEV